MDSSGRIHQLQAFAELAEESRAEAQRKELAELAARVGKVVPIPHAELPMVQRMSADERQAWYRARVDRKAARKRQRAARKAQRRAR